MEEAAVSNIWERRFYKAGASLNTGGGKGKV